MNLLPSLVCSALAVSIPAWSAAAEKVRAPAASTPTATGETLTADTPRTTVDGNRFVAPAGWSLRTRGAAVILTAPEGGSHIALVDVGAAKDADAAVAKAWAAYDPNSKRSLEQSGDRIVRGGWEQIRGYRYQTSPDEQRSVTARALRRGERWTVTIYDVTDAVGSKREAQVGLILGRLAPKGYSRETFAGRSAHKLDAARVEALTQFVDNTRQQLDVPGVALGIVQDGKVVFAGGFGVRQLGKPDQVDADTSFMIASNNKALTTLMLAKLVEAGKFTWDTPVTQVLPTFKLGDADTTRRVLMKHLVCACTGMPRQDMEWMFEGERLTPASVVAMLATMRPTSKFGELYQYSNLMADAAGFAGGHALHPQMELGAAYDAAMQSLVFDPLAMTSTTFDFARALRGNHAEPHAKDIDGNTVPIGMELNTSAIPTRPDGGAWSTVRDMLRYVQMELDRGLLPDGRRYIAEAPLLERRVPQVSMESDMSYGMGLKIDRIWGIPLVRHGGTAFGYVSDMLWLPDQNVGAVILTNAGSSDGGASMRNLFRRRLLEVLFDGNREAVANAPVEAAQMKENLAAERKRLTLPADPAAVSKLAARYRSAELGDLDVLRKGTAIWFDFGGWKSEVASRREKDGSTVWVTVSPGASGYELAVADKDQAHSLILRDEQHEYVFAETK